MRHNLQFTDLFVSIDNDFKRVEGGRGEAHRRKGKEKNKQNGGPKTVFKEKKPQLESLF